MPNYANNPDRASWLHVDPHSDFPIQNIPFGVFLTSGEGDATKWLERGR